jgi:nicotinamidase/pyrazinamidase
MDSEAETAAMALTDIVFWEVDAQADFILPDGKLYVPGAEKLLPNLLRLVDAARQDRVFLISSACQHSPEDKEFNEFPPHCLRGTPGAQIVSEGLAGKVLVISGEAGTSLPEDLGGYQQVVLEKQELDVFSNPHTAALVERLGWPEFVVFGVVTEYCVRCVVLGLRRRGRRVAVVTDAIETLDSTVGERTLQEFRTRGARLITTDEALALLGTPQPAASPASSNP